MITKGRAGLLASGIIVLAALAAYRHSFQGAYLLDDPYSIAENPTIRHLADLRTVLAPPPGLSVSGRPMLNLSLALNYAISGIRIWSYHALNLLIHVCAGLALFGILRRTLEKVGTGAPTLLAFAIALLWTLHPLQTESVTYIIQRAESLMGLCYLLTLYFFIRGAEEEKTASPASVLWLGLSCLACLAGMATKEVMVSAPVLVFLYDRTFLSGSFTAAWRRRWRFYLVLGATWILLAWLVASVGGNRDGSKGFGAGISWWSYALTQFPALATYLRLSFWPRSQMLDYGVIRIRDLAQVWSAALLVTGLALGTLYALWRRPAWGFLGCWFFAILAPSSLLPATTQMTVEHRMYLPLAAVLTAAVLGLDALTRDRRPRPLLRLILLAPVALGLGGLTARRNEHYRNEVALWQDNAAKCPESTRVQYGLGKAELERGNFAAARDALERTLELDPNYVDAIEALATAQYRLGQPVAAMRLYRRVLDFWPRFPEAHDNIGLLLAESGHPADAAAEFATAIRLKPDYAAAHSHLGNAWAAEGRGADAIAEYQRAFRDDPASAEVQNNWGNTLARLNRPDEAMEHFQAALRLNPRYAGVHYNLGNLRFQQGRMADAVREYGQAVAIAPGYAEAHCNLGLALLATGQRAEAIAQYEAALAISPDYAVAHYNLANARVQDGRLPEAIAQYREALRANPQYAEAHANLGNILFQTGQPGAAITQYEEAARLKPDDAVIQYNLANALLGPGRVPEAAEHYAAALRLQPDLAAAKAMLLRIRASGRNFP